MRGVDIINSVVIKDERIGLTGRDGSAAAEGMKLHNVFLSAFVFPCGAFGICGYYDRNRTPQSVRKISGSGWRAEGSEILSYV